MLKHHKHLLKKRLPKLKRSAVLKRNATRKKVTRKLVAKRRATRKLAALTRKQRLLRSSLLLKRIEKSCRVDSFFILNKVGTATLEALLLLMWPYRNQTRPFSAPSTIRFRR